MTIEALEKELKEEKTKNKKFKDQSKKKRGEIDETATELGMGKGEVDQILKSREATFSTKESDDSRPDFKIGKDFEFESSDFEPTNKEIDGSNTSTPEPAPENPFKVKLDELRAQYAQAYQTFYKERGQKIGRINRIKEKFGFKVSESKEPKIPESLTNLKVEYDKALFEYGNDLYKQESERLSTLSGDPASIESQLKKYKSENIFKEVVIDEAQKLSDSKVEALPRKERSAIYKFFAWYNSLNTFQKRALSIGAVTGIGFAIISASSVGVAGAGMWAGTKVLRSVTGAFAGEGAAYAVGRLAKGEADHARETGIDSAKSVIENLSWNNEAFEQAKLQYQKTLEEHTRRTNNIRKKQMWTKILVGGATSFSLSYTHAFENTGLGNNLDNARASVSPEEVANNDTLKSTHEALRGAQGNVKTLDGIIIEDAPVTPELKVGAVSIPVSENGAIATVAELKSKLVEQFGGDLSKAPANVQHIINTNETQLAKDWGLFNPNQPDESAMMLKGSTLDFNKDGSVTLHEIRRDGSLHDTMLSGEGAKTYGGEMFNSDGSSVSGATRLEGGIDIDEAPEKLEGGINIDDAPEKLGGGGEGFDIMQAPGATGSSALGGIPTSNSTPEEILKFMHDHPNTIVRDPSTGLPYHQSDLIERVSTSSIIENGQKINISGQSAVLGIDHKIYVNNSFSEDLTDKFNSERSYALDEAYSRWFAPRPGTTINSNEWAKLHDENMSRLANPDHEFSSRREERLFKNLKNLALKENVDYNNKTMTQVVDEIAIKRMG